jgi:hypothetical protein
MFDKPLYELALQHQREAERRAADHRRARVARAASDARRAVRNDPPTRGGDGPRGAPRGGPAHRPGTGGQRPRERRLPREGDHRRAMPYAGPTVLTVGLLLGLLLTFAALIS